MALLNEKDSLGLPIKVMHRKTYDPQTGAVVIRKAPVWKVQIFAKRQLALVFDDSGVRKGEHPLMILDVETGMAVDKQVRGKLGGVITRAYAMENPGAVSDWCREVVNQRVGKVGMDKFHAAIQREPIINARGEVIPRKI